MGRASPSDRLCKFGHRALVATLLATTAIVAGPGILVGPAMAQDGQVTEFNIPAGPLNRALAAFGSQSGTQLSYEASIASGISSPGARGALSREAALSQILQGSGLIYSFAGPRSVVLTRPDGSLGDVAPDGSIMLGTITLFGQGDLTEGSGLYTAARTSTATGLPVSVEETPQSVTVLTEQRIKDQGAKTVREALAYSAGVTGYGAGVGTDLEDALYSRGFVMNNFQIDGAPATSLGTGHDTVIYDRIDVVRGAAGMAAGMGSPAGTVNMMRKRPTAEPQSSFSFSAGSWDRYGATADVSGALNDSGTIRGRLIVDVKDEKSWLDRYAMKSQTIYGITEVDLDNGDLLTFGLSWQENNSDAALRTGHPLFYADGSQTDFDRSTNHAPDWSYYDKERTTAFTAIRREFTNGWTGTAELSFSRYKYDGVSYYVDGLPDATTGAGTSIVPVRWQGDEKQVALNAHASGTFRMFGREHDLAFGISLAKGKSDGPSYGGWLGSWTGYDGTIENIFTYDGSGIAVPAFTKASDSDIDEHQYSAYVNSRFHLSDRTKLFAGLRVIDWKRTSTTTTVAGVVSGVTQNPDPVIVPYLGLFHELTDNMAVYASYTSIFNPVSASSLDVNGDPFDPDEGVSYEGGMKFRLADDDLLASVAYFHTDQEKLTQWDMTQWVTRQGVVSKGIEAELTGELRDGWNIAASYTYTDSENADGSRTTYMIPRHSVKLYSTYRLPGEWEGVTLGGGVVWQSPNGYDLSDSAYVSQGSYAVVNAMARYDFSDGLSATLHVNNLFDKSYLVTSGSWGVYGAPRNISLNLTSRF